jgi:predicted transglutaminase-like cysteine proteinase
MTAQVGDVGDDIKAMPTRSPSPVRLFLPSRARFCAGRVALRLRAYAMVWLLLLAGLLAFAPGLFASDAERMRAAARQMGPQADAGLRALESLLESVSAADDEDKLRAVNDFFNRRIRYRDDIEVWGVEDYWASPLELLGKGEGDCEDYAIAKYFSLLVLGMPSSRLRMVYVRARIAGPPPRMQAHMVLAYYATAGAEPEILDNLVPRVLPASERSDLTPVFGFNSDGLWQGLGAQSSGDPAARLSPWRGVLAKARAEGFL